MFAFWESTGAEKAPWRPLPFLLPLYRGVGASPAEMRIGMAVYEILSGFRNHRLHRFLSREETLLMAPGLPTTGLMGGCLYYDGVVSDSRWTLEILKDGVRQNAVAMNYCPVTGLLKENGRVIGAMVEDRMGGGRYPIRARAVVNATGVFADRIRRMDQHDARPLVRLSKGTHLVFTEQDVPLTVTVVFNSPVDGRPLFLVKREGCFLFGTSDDWEDSEPEAPVPGRHDVDYLLESLRKFMPEADLNRTKVQFAYSGFRPLLSPGDRNRSSADASREDLMEVSPSGLMTAAGGKLTTARRMAIRVLDRVFRRIGRNSRWGPCRTDELSIGGTNEALAEALSNWTKRCPRLADYFRILFQRYGLDADGICEEAMRVFLGRHPDPRAEPIRAEVQYVCRREMVCTVEDLIERRAGFLYWNREKRLERLRHGAHVIREELGLTEFEFEEQFAAYRRYLEQFHSVPGSDATD